MSLNKALLFYGRDVQRWLRRLEKSSQGRLLTVGDKGEMFAIHVRRMLGKVSGGRGGLKQK